MGHISCVPRPHSRLQPAQLVGNFTQRQHRARGLHAAADRGKGPPGVTEAVSLQAAGDSGALEGVAQAQVGKVGVIVHRRAPPHGPDHEAFRACEVANRQLLAAAQIAVEDPVGRRGVASKVTLDHIRDILVAEAPVPHATRRACFTHHDRGGGGHRD